jgi:hypothetical protein
MLGSRWLPSAPTSREAGDASASGARQQLGVFAQREDAVGCLLS